MPHEPYATVPHFGIPFAPITEEGRRPHSMFVDLLENDHVLRPIVVFRDEEDLRERMELQVIAPAEARLAKRQALLNQLFPRE